MWQFTVFHSHWELEHVVNCCALQRKFSPVRNKIYFCLIMEVMKLASMVMLLGFVDCGK